MFKNILFVLFVAGLAGFGSLVLWGGTAGVFGLVVGGLIAAASVAVDAKGAER